MKAIALDHFGGRETMKLQMLPVPEVGPDEVLIHVEWAGVGQWDSFEREGGLAREFSIEAKFPYVLGSDQAIEKLNRLIEPSGPPGTRPFEVHVARSFRLDQAAEAHRALDEHYLGKLVLQTA